MQIATRAEEVIQISSTSLLPFPCVISDLLRLLPDRLTLELEVCKGLPHRHRPRVRPSHSRPNPHLTPHPAHPTTPSDSMPPSIKLPVGSFSPSPPCAPSPSSMRDRPHPRGVTCGLVLQTRVSYSSRSLSQSLAVPAVLPLITCSALTINNRTDVTATKSTLSVSTSSASGGPDFELHRRNICNVDQ